MSDYGDVVEDSGFESDLGTFNAEQEASGYDALTTSQEGIKQDEFMKDSGMAIDQLGDAQKAKKASEEKSRDGAEQLREHFEERRHHIDNHEYKFNLGGQDYKITHGELKNFMKNEIKELKKKLDKTTNEQDRMMLMLQMHTLQEIQDDLEAGKKLTEEQKDYLNNDYFVNNPDARDRFIKQAETHNSELVSAEVNNDLLEARREFFDANDEISRRSTGIVVNGEITSTGEFNAQSDPAADMFDDDMSLEPMLLQTNDEFEFLDCEQKSTHEAKIEVCMPV